MWQQEGRWGEPAQQQVAAPLLSPAGSSPSGAGRGNAFLQPLIASQNDLTTSLGGNYPSYATSTSIIRSGISQRNAVSPTNSQVDLHPPNSSSLQGGASIMKTPPNCGGAAERGAVQRFAMQAKPGGYDVSEGGKIERGFDVSRMNSIQVVAPPDDLELFKTIQRVAGYCSNYPDMEEYVRRNNGHEHKFRFLMGGEGSDYFRFLLYCMKNGIDPEALLSQANKEKGYDAAGSSGEPLANQLSAEQSNAQKLSYLYEEPSPPEGTLSEDMSKELNDLLASLEALVTSEIIRKARHWVEVNCQTVKSLKQVAYAILKIVESLASFEHKLHVLYLVHDVIQHEAMNGESGTMYLDGFKPYLVWILRSVYQYASKLNDGSTEKVENILSLWSERKIVDNDEWREMQKIMSLQKLPEKQEKILPVKPNPSRKKRSRFDQGPDITSGTSSMGFTVSPQSDASSSSIPPSSVSAVSTAVPSSSLPAVNLVNTLDQQQLQQLYSPAQQQSMMFQPSVQGGLQPPLLMNAYGGFHMVAQAPQMNPSMNEYAAGMHINNIPIPAGTPDAAQPVYQVGGILPLQQPMGLMGQNFPVSGHNIPPLYGFGGGIVPPPPPPSASNTSIPSGVPGGGFDKKPETLALTPETVPVGVMATMLKTLSKRGKNMQTAFVPYKPLDAMSTPQILPPIDSPSSYLLERVDDFYAVVRMIEDAEEWDFGREKRDSRRDGDLKSHRSSRRPPRSGRSDGSSSRSRSRSRSSDRSRSRSGSSTSRSRSNSSERRRYPRGRDGGWKSGGSDWERPTAWAQAEMGVGEDGSVLGSLGSLKGDRLGLGALTAERQAENDEFEKFRRRSANKYHEHIAQNQASRREPGGLKKPSDIEKLCYACHKPGHLAKDCKYGLS